MIHKNQSTELILHNITNIMQQLHNDILISSMINTTYYNITQWLLIISMINTTYTTTTY
jgi:hypothetical protein